MKFSWISLNYFINLDNIHISQLAELLTITGFEIDDINNNDNFKDYIIDIAITANRQDTLSIIGLATEISKILNKPIYQKYKKLQYHCNYNTLKSEVKFKYLSNLRFNKILRITNNISPLWLQNYLAIHDIEAKNLIYDIKEYTKIKWGETIHFFNITNIETPTDISIHNYDLYEEIKYNQHYLIQISHNHTKINHDIEYKSESQSILACHYSYNRNYNETNYSSMYSIQGYDEALQLIATFSQGYISKSYSYINQIKEKKYKLQINKNLIKKTLGPIHDEGSKYLKHKTIYKILNQLNLQPKYNYYNKNFIVTIEKYRVNDLYRKIDIIEEIGRIYGYQNFIDNIPHINQTGTLSKQYKIIKTIRQYFRDNGIHEVLNSSLEKPDNDEFINNSMFTTIDIFNPLSIDQSHLRNTLLDNLIKNKIYNYKQKNSNVEFFEIGKVFINNTKKNIKQEVIHLAGLFANTDLIKQSWETKNFKLNWFHAKGILEQFFEKLNIKVTWHQANTLKPNTLQHLSVKNFNLQKTTSIHHAINNQIIGIIGELNYNLYKEIPKNENINIFELNLQELINCYHTKKHSSYIFSHYSIYPSVIRDISIKVNKHYPITDIIKFIQNVNPQLIQKVEVFNQYKNINYINEKYIGIRIIYNNKHKTLTQNDLQLIEKDIKLILDTYQSI